MDVIPTLECMYTCTICGLRKQKVDVPIRGPEDVVSWLQQVAIVKLAEDHHKKSFLCPAKALDIYVPVPEDVERIGDLLKN